MIAVIKQYIPKIILQANINDSKIREALEKYSNRNTKFKELMEDMSVVIKPHSFFDWVLLAHKGDNKALSFLNYLQNQVVELLENTDSKFHNKIKATIREMILSVETDVNQLKNPVHMNFVGEMVGLNHVLKHSGHRFKLEGIERVLSNGKKVDFVFLDNDNNDLMYVDFVSIHNIDTGKLSTSDDLVNFLEGRFNSKLEGKTINLVEATNRIHDRGVDVNFAVLPIIWTEISELLKFKDTFVAMDKKYANVFSCCSLLPQELDDKSIVYDFCTVNHILDRWGKH